MSALVNRFYFESALTGGLQPHITPTSFASGWNKTSGAVDRGLSPVAQRAGGTATAMTNTGTGVSGQFVCVSRHVFGPLMPQTISGTLKGQIRCKETNTTDNYTAAVAVRVLKWDGSERGVALAVSASDDTSATPPEMAITTSTNRKMQDSAESATLTLTSTKARRGDFLCVELGFRQASTSVAAGTIDPTSSSSSDVAEDNTSTTGRSWIEFSNAIQFGSYFYGSSAPVPPDNDATGVGDAVTSTLVPPSGMLPGDLIYIEAMVQAGSGNITIGNAAGQIFSNIGEVAFSDAAAIIFFATFTGVWSANPTVTCASLSGTQPFSCRLHVIRPPSILHYWFWTNDQGGLGFSGPIIATATVPNGNIEAFVGASSPLLGLSEASAFYQWATEDDNTWSGLSAGYTVAGSDVQVRNLAGSDCSMSAASLIRSFGEASGATFDGTNDYLKRGAGLTGAVDGKTGAFFCLLKLNSDPGVDVPLLVGVTALGGATARFTVLWRTSDHKIQVIGKNAAGTTILDLSSGGTIDVSSTTWRAVRATWNLATPDGEIGIDLNIASTTKTTTTNDNLDYTLADWAVAAYADGTSKAPISIGELFFAPSIFPGSSFGVGIQSFFHGSSTFNGPMNEFTPLNRQMLDIGFNGAGGCTAAQSNSLVTPLIYLSIRDEEAVTDFATNRGTGGDFTITGTLDLEYRAITFMGGHFGVPSYTQGGAAGVDNGVVLATVVKLLPKDPAFTRSPYNTLLRM